LITRRPLALTDDQLDQIMRHAAVLHPHLRRIFVEHVAYELRGQVVGDGVVFRACAKVLKESGMFDPPGAGLRPHAARQQVGAVRLSAHGATRVTWRMLPPSATCSHRSAR